jgi:probable HAF family extracellular repeat protein
MKLTLIALPITLLCVSLVCGTAFAQVQPPNGTFHSFGLPMPQLEAQPMGLANREVQSSSSPALSFTFGMIDFPGQMASGAFSANKAGHIVGGYGPDLVTNWSDHGFLLKGTKFTAIDYPGAGWTQPLAINDAGVIVGTYGANPHIGAVYGFKLTGKNYTSIDYPGANYTRPTGINKSGDIVGEAIDSTDHGFLLSKGVFSSIAYPGAAYTVAWSINNAGEIVGYYGLTQNDSHGFLYSKGTFTTLDYPGGYSYNVVSGMNDSGLIVGGYGDPITVNGVVWYWEHCYVYQSGQFTSCDAPFGPPAVTEPWHLNDYGVITGTYADNSSTVYGFEALVGP